MLAHVGELLTMFIQDDPANLPRPGKTTRVLEKKKIIKMIIMSIRFNMDVLSGQKLDQIGIERSAR